MDAIQQALPAAATRPGAVVWQTERAHAARQPGAGRVSTAPRQIAIDRARPFALAGFPTALADAYQPSGGLIAGDDIARMLRRHADQPLSTLAHWILAREVVCIPWEFQSVLPMFQFDTSDMTLRPEIVDVVRELAGALDDWDLALWFVTPNSWLDGATPVATIAADHPSVLQAARADRFIARG